MSTVKKLSNDRQGAALVEFTVVLPFLLVLGFGVFEFGNLLYGYHLINTGIEDAARYLSRVDDPNAKAAQAKELAVYGQIGGSSKRVAWWNVGDITVAVTPIANPVDPGTGTRTYRGPDPIQVVRVSTTATYPGLGFLSFLGFGSGISFSAFHELRVIYE
jgi:Flp pilus assembly protein TadG